MTRFFSNLTRLMFSKNVYLSSLTTIVAIFGDVLLEYTKKPIHKAVFDNTTHAAIGGLSWLIVSINQRKHRNAFQEITEILFCTVIASLIDVDHFIAARSISLKNATNLSRRPFLHCSSIPIVLTAYLLLLSYYYDDLNLQKVGFIIFTAFGTHHTRDATRRGYWLYPFGQTPPVPYVLYLGITVGIPYFVCVVIKFMNLGKRTEVVNIDI